MEDIKRRYGLILEINDLFNYSEYLYKNFIKVAVYLKAGLVFKARYIKVWKKGPGEG